MSQSALAAVETPSPRSQAHPTRTSSRLTAIDALRGFALLLMTIDHSGSFAHVQLEAENHGSLLSVLPAPLYFLVGLLTNLAAPTFWIVSGMSIALLSARNRRDGRPEWEITRFLVIRAGILLFLDLTIVPFSWTSDHSGHYTWTFDLLSSLAMSMLLLALLRYLPRTGLWIVTLAMLLGFGAIAQRFAPAIVERFGEPAAVWLSYTHRNIGAEFPVLGWCGLMMLGYLLGGQIGKPSMRRPLTWLVAGGALLAAWLGIRLLGGYGNFFPWHPGDDPRYFFVMSKGPPDLAFMSFNLGLSAIVFALFLSDFIRLDRRPFGWLVTLGRASLFVYALHLPLYRALGHFATGFFPHDPGIRHLVAWAVGLAIVLPLAAWYGSFKKSRPQSVFRYL
jgi:uncharacterized membrane protein